VITVNMIGKVKRVHSRDRISLSDMVRRTELSRNTVKKWVEVPTEIGPRYPGYFTVATLKRPCILLLGCDGCLCVFAEYEMDLTMKDAFSSEAGHKHTATVKYPGERHGAVASKLSAFERALEKCWRTAPSQCRERRFQHRSQ
jgi:hypothetical protein